MNIAFATRDATLLLMCVRVRATKQRAMTMSPHIRRATHSRGAIMNPTNPANNAYFRESGQIAPAATQYTQAIEPGISSQLAWMEKAETQRNRSRHTSAVTVLRHTRQ